MRCSTLQTQNRYIDKCENDCSNLCAHWQNHLFSFALSFWRLLLVAEAVAMVTLVVRALCTLISQLWSQCQWPHCDFVEPNSPAKPASVAIFFGRLFHGNLFFTFTEITSVRDSCNWHLYCMRVTLGFFSLHLLQFGLWVCEGFSEAKAKWCNAIWHAN